MEFNLTVGHMAGSFTLSYILSMFLHGKLLLRAIAWVFLWQLLTPTNDVWYEDLMMCFMLFSVLELINNFVKNQTNKL